MPSDAPAGERPAPAGDDPLRVPLAAAAGLLVLGAVWLMALRFPLLAFASVPLFMAAFLFAVGALAVWGALLARPWGAWTGAGGLLGVAYALGLGVGVFMLPLAFGLAGVAAFARDARGRRNPPDALAAGAMGIGLALAVVFLGNAVEASVATAGAAAPGFEAATAGAVAAAVAGVAAFALARVGSMWGIAGAAAALALLAGAGAAGAAGTHGVFFAPLLLAGAALAGAGAARLALARRGGAVAAAS